jgi:hypothetical protein
MPPLYIVAWLTALPAPADFEIQNVRVHVETFSSNYKWTVENRSAKPISRFDIPVYHTYNYTVPDGWESKVEAGQFQAWTQDPDNAIRPGATEEFALTVTSLGAVIGEVPARFGFTDGSELVFPKMWGPVQEPAATIYLIPMVIALLAGLHVAVLTLRAKQRPHESP